MWGSGLYVVAFRHEVSSRFTEGRGEFINSPDEKQDLINRNSDMIVAETGGGLQKSNTLNNLEKLW